MRNETISVYDTLTGKIKRECKKHTACVRDVSWHPFRNEILTSSWDGTIGRWTYIHKEDEKKPKEKPNRDTIRRSLRLALKNKKVDIQMNESPQEGQENCSDDRGSSH